MIAAQGSLFFGSAERLTRRIMAVAQEAGYIIVDMRRVFSADAAARALIKRMVRRVGEKEIQLIFAQTGTDSRRLSAGRQRRWAARLCRSRCCARMVRGSPPHRARGSP